MSRRDPGQGKSATMSRRALLASGTGAVAGAAGATLLDAPIAGGRANSRKWVGDPSGRSVNGTVKAARDGSLVLERYHLSIGKLPAGAKAPTGSTVALKVPGDAHLYRGHRVTLGDYRRGDKIIAYVKWEDGELVVRGAEPLFTPIRGWVKSRKGSRLRVDNHTVRLNEYTYFEPTREYPPGRSLDDVAKGQQVWAVCWYDPPSREYVADKVGITGV
jgi:hypothetical protein